MDIDIRLLTKADIQIIENSFVEHTWSKPPLTFEKYFLEQEAGKRLVWVAYCEEKFAGHITLNYQPDYEPFYKENIPEINDFNVLPIFRNKGIGSKLIDRAENQAFKNGNIVGLGVGLYEGYGPAQKLYIKRGYIPNGQTITYNNKPLIYGDRAILDDDLVLWFTKEKSTKKIEISL